MRLVYLSPVPLASFAQRPHHFVRWFHDRFGAEVMWIDPYPSRLPKTSDIPRLWRRPVAKLGPVWASDSWVKVVSVPAVPFEPLALGRNLNRWLWKNQLDQVGEFISSECWIVAAKPCELALELRRQFPRCPLAFDVLDNIPAFSSGLSRSWMEMAETQVAEQADWIITSSSPLYRKFADTWPDKTRLVRNGLSPIDQDCLKDRSSIREPILGYIGAIASWFDWSSVIALATENPGTTVQLIGPCEHAPRNLPENISLLPAIPHDRVYAAMNNFSAGLIPFQSNSLTEYVDPIKYYEYRAMGLPVLSTKFGEMRYRSQIDDVYFLEEFPDIQALLRFHDASKNEGKLQKFLQENCWNSRFDQLDIFTGSPCIPH